MSLKSDMEASSVAWVGHTRECNQCAKVDLGQTQTLVHSCAEGSRLLRELLHLNAKKENDKKVAAQRRRQQQLMGNKKASKSELAAVMRYK